MVHGLHNPSLIMDITIFGTTFGCINLAFFQWLTSRKNPDKEKRNKRKDTLQEQDSEMR